MGLFHREQQKQWGGIQGTCNAEMSCDSRLHEKRVKHAMIIEVTTSI
jgi:hypothetical protein